MVSDVRLPLIEVTPYRVSVSGPNAAANAGEGFFAALMDDAEVHPAKRLVKGVYGPNVQTALSTLRRVIDGDYWLGDGAKRAAADAIDARQGVLS